MWFGFKDHLSHDLNWIGSKFYLLFWHILCARSLLCSEQCQHDVKEPTWQRSQGTIWNLAILMQILWLYCAVSFQDLANAWFMIKNDTNSLRYNCIMHWWDVTPQLPGHVFWFALASTVSIEPCMHFQVTLQHIITAIFMAWCNRRAMSLALLHWLNNTMAYYMSLLVLTVSVTIIRYTKHHYRLLYTLHLSCRGRQEGLSNM